MKRFFRILRSTVIIVSLFLTLASLFFWVRSYVICDWLTFRRMTLDTHGNRIPQSAMLRSSLGRIVFAFGPSSWEAINPLGFEPPEGFNWFRRPAYYYYDSNNHVIWDRAGFQIINSRKNWPTGPVAVRGFQLPYWFLTLIFGLSPAWWIMNHFRHSKRGLANLCPVCGYDLRATPDRCPECGTARRAAPLPSPSSSL